jgi:hypothetical protein
VLVKLEFAYTHSSHVKFIMTITVYITHEILLVSQKIVNMAKVEKLLKSYGTTSTLYLCLIFFSQILNEIKIAQY